MDPDVDLKKYFNIYYNTKLLHTVFPGVRFESPTWIPSGFADKKDKVLAISYLLQHNPIDKVNEAIGSKRLVNGEKKDTGWQNEERSAIIFLLKLKEFSPEKVHQFMKQRAGTGLSNSQIRDWVDLFHKGGRKSIWGQRVSAFADHTPTVSWDRHLANTAKDVCPNCGGYEAHCRTCGGTGKLPEHMRNKLVADAEHENFRKKLG